MVSEPPKAASSPNTAAAATIAIPSGSSRIGGPKISARVRAMTTSATARRTKISSESFWARPSTTTGTPLTTYSASRMRKVESSTAARICSIASRRSVSLSSGRSRIRIWAASALGQNAENRGFGSPGLRLSKTTDWTKVGSSSRGIPVCP